MAGPGNVLAVDVGGTKLAAGLVGPDGRLVTSVQVPTKPSEAGRGEELWATLAELLVDLCGGNSPVAVGIGCGGPMRWPEGAVSPLNLPAWRDFPLRARIRDLFDGVPVRLVNDAIAMAIAEHWRGAGVGSRAFLGVVVSTGVGGGLVLDGRVLTGGSGNAGHIGHAVVDPDGPPCGCGGRGCLEAIARGPALVEWALAHGWRGPPGADGRALRAAATAGDPVARAAFERAGSALGVAIATAAHLLELDTVAVGGGLSSAGELLLDPARRTFAAHVRMGFASRCAIVPAVLGVDAGLIGAAALVIRPDQYWAAEGAD
ncbi:MAG TPA: ROK family protein [Mycobacteriales bacterium]|nr:ROK family protein [Mycobacteriales bacterium]